MKVLDLKSGSSYAEVSYDKSDGTVCFEYDDYGGTFVFLDFNAEELYKALGKVLEKDKE